MNKENSNENKEKTLKEENLDLSNIFDSFIKEGVVIREKEVTPGFKIKVKVLDTSELLIAEAIISTKKAPTDIVARVRAASILSQAIISINGDKIERDDFDKNKNINRRFFLYNQLIKLPALVIHKAYEFYIECVDEQNKKYENTDETVEEIKNF